MLSGTVRWSRTQHEQCRQRHQQHSERHTPPPRRLDERVRSPPHSLPSTPVTVVIRTHFSPLPPPARLQGPPHGAVGVVGGCGVRRGTHLSAFEGEWNRYQRGISFIIKSKFGGG